LIESRHHYVITNLLTDLTLVNCRLFEGCVDQAAAVVATKRLSGEERRLWPVAAPDGAFVFVSAAAALTSQGRRRCRQ
jgi:hypothetical protein